MIVSANKVIKAMQVALDTKAIEIAAAVAADQREHKNECRDRYMAIDHKLDAQDERFDRAMERLNAFLWKIAIGIITVLLVLIGWLAIQLYTHLATLNGWHAVAAIECPRPTLSGPRPGYLN